MLLSPILSELLMLTLARGALAGILVRETAGANGVPLLLPFEGLGRDDLRERQVLRDVVARPMVRLKLS